MIGPIAAGILVLMLGLLAMVIHLLRWTWREGRRLSEVQRVGQGRCPCCAYDLAGRLSEACSECGHVFTRKERRRLEGMFPALARMRERGTR